MPTPPSRTAQQHRRTGETDVKVDLDLDGTGTADIHTGVGFFDHMLDLLSRHSMIDLKVKAQGDLHVDPHHTVEDVGIVFGVAVAEALGDKAGIRRYGQSLTPMDECLAEVAVDLSGRPHLAWDVTFSAERIGDFPSELVEEFFRAVAQSARASLHLGLRADGNAHHAAEALFKGFARALRQAVELDPRRQGVPSTKGTL